MKKSQKFLITFLAVAFSAYFIYQTLSKAGVFLHLQPYSEYQENSIKTSPGIEDITVDPETNIAYLSSCERRVSDATGNLFSINLQDSLRVPKDLTSHFGLKEFRPHGISLLNINGKKFLFIISHTKTKQDILRFEISGDSLLYLNKYASTDLTSPNDILAIGENQFFVTNDHDSRIKWKVMMNDFLRIPSGNVVYFDGEKTKVVSQKLTYPNGIALSKDGRKIYVASTLDKTIEVFEPQAQTHYLKSIASFSTKYSPDNIEINREGNLLVGCHPKLFAFMNHRKSDKNLSPSAVIELDHENLENQKTKYLNLGESISGSSVAAPYYGKNQKQNLLVGSVFNSKVLELKNN
jgi:arylesterase/paraoxonase